MISLDFDLTPLWTAVNTNFPVFMSILAVPAAIGISIIIAKFIINAISDAFRKNA